MRILDAMGAPMRRRRVIAALILPTLFMAGSDASARAATKQLRPRTVSRVQRCNVEIHRYSQIVEMDRGIFDAFKNFDQIDADIAAAIAACQAGRDAAARAIVSASERRNGYPWPL
ncbi:MAG TPA: hypothetical protein VG271_06540 [Beijerinckiaceae bacterium]|jgi:hypothetical protein|nr:hypothetical protein [Beijerinckiaceae bacterium]